ncbi:hypothetical protein G210_2925 [Candida maltosa Xu316]|uniref:Major facilitator superfamily (MFS) profile domain-containing protein n=1 Tax=Candida maltosa (strain Xu316) TaxID=1245528 RepID=M3IK87_CANMX|nr:hypothetical protein G210_2925 [Candida maltosa Xu316]
MTVAKNITFRQQMKGFPVWQMVVISIIRVSEPITFTSLFPYVFFMIRDFEIAPTPADIAKYSGYLSASFAFCQFLCCVQWGKASDKYGRKPILLCGLAGTALSILIFGFSQNFWVAMFARSLMGSLNGNIAVLRTAIGEIATHRNHQSIAFSTLPLLWNFGAVIGPIIGGSKYLTRPKKRNDVQSKIERFFMSAVDEVSDENSLYNRFMNRFPYALSNIVIASILVFSLIVGFLFLEETQERARKKRDIGLEIGDFILTKLGFEVPTRPWQKKRIAVERREEPLITNDNESIASLDSEEETNEEQTNLISEPQPFYNTIDGEEDDDDESDDSPKFIGPMTRRYSDALVRRYSSAQLGPVLTTTTTNNSIISTNIEQKFTSDIFTAAVVQTIIVNFLLSFHNIVYSEFLPVMLAGQVMPEKSKFPLKIVGGFGYDSDTIGTLLSFTGLVGTLSVMFIFPVLDRNYKTITSLRASQILFPLAYPILPYLIFTLRAYKSANPPWLTKYLLYGMCCIMTASNAIGFPNILVLIHRAAAPQHRAFINGTALSLNSLARFLGPMIWGYVMTLSEKFEVGELSWVLLGFLALVCSFYTFVMKDYEEDDEIVQESV